MSLGIGKNMSFDLDTAARVLTIYSRPGRLSVRQAEAELGYNSAKIFGFRSWLEAMGMLEVSGRQVVPTLLSAVIRRHDPGLGASASVRLLYYEISTNPAAEVWYALVNYILYDAFLNGRAASYREVREGLASLGVGAGSSALKQRDKDAGLALGALTSPRAFGRLNLLASESAGGRQVRLHRQPANPLLLAYDLLKHRPSGAPYHRLGDLTAPGRAARVFFWSPAEVEEGLGSLEAAGLVRVVRSAGLNQVAWRGPDRAGDIVERMYERPD